MQPAIERATPVAPVWSPALRVLFRFVFSYLVLYNFPFPLYYIPYAGRIASPYEALWPALVPWVGTHLFHVDASTLPNGSGDTTYNYVQVFCFLVIASIVAVVWTILDRKRAHYARLHEGLRIYVGFALGAAMLSYGASKVIQAQFPEPPLDRLLQPMGDASPMGLVWTFMGASAAYNVFAGAAEMIAGLLLTARRTTLLGALVSLGVLTNVVALNFFYDVPVKLYSSHLLAMAIFLIVPDLRRLVDLLVLHRGVEPVAIPPLVRRLWLRRGALVLRTLSVVAYTAFLLHTTYEDNRTYFQQESKAPLHGIWNVDEMGIDGQVRPPLVTDRERWRRVIFHSPGTMAIQLMSDSRVRYVLHLDNRNDLNEGVMTLGKRDDAKWKTTFSYAQPKSGLLTLEGTLDGRKIRARLHLEKPPQFLLTTRGFHWINERPFNR